MKQEPELKAGVIHDHPDPLRVFLTMEHFLSAFDKCPHRVFFTSGCLSLLLCDLVQVDDPKDLVVLPLGQLTNKLALVFDTLLLREFWLDGEAHLPLFLLHHL